MSSSKLFEKVILNNNVEVPSRLSIAPLTLFSSNPDGTINDEEREYLKLRGTNIGLYILGAAVVSQEGITAVSLPRCYDEKRDFSSLEERAKIIKSQGALAINQIHHGGGLALKEYSELDPVVPSADVYPGKGYHELTDSEIKKIIDNFAYAAELSIKSGYDGVEIHGANNFLIQQFYSPHTNHRTDEWGGSDEKRMNLALKIVDAVCEIKEKYKCPKFIIGYRLSPEEPYEDGLTMTETLKLIRALVKKPLQYIHISQKDYFKKARRGEGEGIERLKLIHDETKGKVALIGVGGLTSEKDLI
jgi:2,4-dienoyl-CoA reductase-like NADH-dependent reductase (Old Yellow Enzyme family)